MRNTIHQCINSNLSDKIELIRIENRHLKTLNKNLRELAISSEAALQNNTLDTRIKILRELVRNWRESVTTLVVIVLTSSPGIFLENEGLVPLKCGGQVNHF